MAKITNRDIARMAGVSPAAVSIAVNGKDGISDNLVKQANDALEARELIKGKVLENSMLTAREAAEELKVATRSQVVQVIGNKFVLYRMQHDKTKRKIQLLKASRRRE